jgi:hypothetical protein
MRVGLEGQPGFILAQAVDCTSHLVFMHKQGSNSFRKRIHILDMIVLRLGKTNEAEDRFLAIHLIFLTSHSKTPISYLNGLLMPCALDYI